MEQQYLQENTQLEAPELNIRDYIRIMRRGMWFIVFAIILVLVITIYYTFTVTPEYEATATILIDQPQGSSTLFDLTGTRGMARLSNAQQLISSRNVAVGVVRTLWNSKHRNHLSLFGTQVFRPRGQRPRRWIREIISLGMYEPDKNPGEVQNGPYTERIGYKFAGGVQGSIDVTNERGTDLLKVTCTSPFPEEASLLTNTVINVFQQLDQKWNAEEFVNMEDFLGEQVAAKELELSAAEDTLRLYKEQTKIFGLDGNSVNLLRQLVEEEAKYYNTIAEVEIVKEEIRYINTQLSEEEKTLADQLQNSINTRLVALRMEISGMESELVKNASLYGENHEAVRSIKRKINALKTKLDEQTRELISQGLAVADPIEYRQEMITELLVKRAGLAALETRSAEYKKVVDIYNEQLNRLPTKQLDFARLERDRAVLHETFMFMRQKLEEARISVASEPGTVRIIDKAIPPKKPSSPKHKTNILLGLILGMGLGVGVVFLREYMDNTVRSIDFIEKLGQTVLGIIPEVGKSRYARYDRKGRARRRKPRRRRGKREESVDEGFAGLFRRPSGESLRRRLITEEDPKSPISEAYRMIRTNILYSQADKPIKSIIVTSPGAGEGKTTTVTNLAITFAHLGKRTLLLDTDLRRPVIHRIFDIDRAPGITHYLSGEESDFNSLVQETDIENLFVVTSGISPPNPSELMGSERMTQLIAKLEEEWDVILMDSPPFAAVTDASMISRELDGLVLVVRAGSTVKEALIRSLRALGDISTPLTGIILNSVSKRTSSDSYYYYYQYYYHYYGYSDR